MTTNVPVPTFSDKGFIAPSEQDILTGVQADINSAFGGNLNPALNTPQGQIAQSLTAIIGDANNQFLALANGVDPAFASGRMQDAIARIYFLKRNPAQSTLVTATCSGLPGVTIPIGAQAVDQGGNIYLCTQTGLIPSGGTIDLIFAAKVPGPLACPIGFLNAIYQAIPGWDGLTNAAAGIVGNDVESRQDFEFRRQNAVAANAQGSLNAVLGAVFNVPDVVDAYVAENTAATATGVTVTASIATTNMTVTATSGVIKAGMMVVGSGVAQGTLIGTQTSGTTGSTGVYVVNISQSVSSESMVCSPGGYSLAAKSLYVAVYGGDQDAIAQAIWSKKSPGCAYNGNTTVTVTDTGPTNFPYEPPYPTYDVTFEIPTAVAIVMLVTLSNSVSLPSGYVGMVQAAVLAAFNGQDGGQRARIGSTIFSSRFYPGITALGPWANIVSIQVGVGTANKNSVATRIDQIPTLAQSAISVATA